MSRKGPSKKHQLLPDPIYGSTVVAQLINKILLDGKKSIAEDIVYSALDMVKEKTDQEPVAVLKRALDNIRPSLPPRRWRYLPGSGRSEAGSCEHSVPALADRLLPRPS
jgi:small subunit ribosomal protein S7